MSSMILKEKEKMADDTQYETALGQYDVPSRGARITQIRQQGFVVLHGKEWDFVQACKGMSVDIPVQPLQLCETGEQTTLWISPDEFLHILPLEEVNEFINEAEQTFANMHAVVVDNSGGYTHLRIEEFIDLLAPLCFYDIANSLPVGKVIATFVGKAPALLFRLPSDKDGLRMLVRFSFADYVYRLLRQTETQLI